MTNELWEQWIEKINWILNIAKKRNWVTEELQIKPTVTNNDFKNLESELEISYPEDFEEVLTNYSSGILMGWQFEGEGCRIGEYDTTSLWGGNRDHLWDFSTLKETYNAYKEWIEECFPNEDDGYDKVWHNKVPFLHVLNGDIIAFGENTGQGNPVIYLSHEGGDYHGNKLGDNFIDFITKWTNLGCIDPEEFHREVFYDYKKGELKTEGDTFDDWIKWLEK